MDFVANSGEEYINFSTPGSYPDIDSTGRFVAFSHPVISSTPEPSSLLLFGTGLLGLAFVAFQKAKSSGLVLHT